MKKKEEKGLEVKKYPERKGRTVRLTQNLFQTGYIKSYHSYKLNSINFCKEEKIKI